MTRIALYQARTGIDPAANARALVAAVEEAAAGGAEMLFTPEMSGLLDRDRARASAHYRATVARNLLFKALVEVAQGGTGATRIVGHRAAAAAE